MYTIEQIEDAIITTLQPLKTTHSVRAIKTYQGELDSEDRIVRAVTIFPAIITMYAGSSYAEHGNRKVETMRYLLFICDKKLRDEQESRRGVYAMLNAVRPLLFNKLLSLQIFPFRLLREDPVWFGSGVSIYSAEYETAQALLYTE